MGHDRYSGFLRVFGPHPSDSKDQTGPHPVVVHSNPPHTVVPICPGSHSTTSAPPQQQNLHPAYPSSARARSALFQEKSEKNSTEAEFKAAIRVKLEAPKKQEPAHYIAATYLTPQPRPRPQPQPQPPIGSGRPLPPPKPLPLSAIPPSLQPQPRSPDDYKTNQSVLKDLKKESSQRGSDNSDKGGVNVIEWERLEAEWQCKLEEERKARREARVAVPVLLGGGKGKKTESPKKG